MYTIGTPMGVENWELAKRVETMLETFHHRRIRNDLKIKMARVKEEQLTNEKFRQMFGKIRSIKKILKQCTLIFVGNIIHELKVPSTEL